MGRSFDRGGQNRKERMRGKRRAYQQAERDREARDAVRQARSSGRPVVAVNASQHHPQVVAAAVMAAAPVASQPATAKQPGFFARTFGRLFGKAA